MEQLISQGPDRMSEVFAELFNLALRLEREQFLEAGLYERTAERRGYANVKDQASRHARWHGQAERAEDQGA